MTRSSVQVGRARLLLSALFIGVGAQAQVDGTLDPSFGTDGIATVFFDLPGGGFFRDLARDVALQPDGKIVVVGEADYDGQGDRDFAIARLLPNGFLDGTFSGDGRTTVFFDLGGVKADQAFAVALQNDGKIVVAGRAMAADGTSDPALARLLPNGNLDATFGTGGKITHDLSSGLSDTAYAVVVLNDGRILIAGQKDNDAFVARLLGNGALDPSFGAFGFSLSGAQSVAPDLALQADGKIMLVSNTDTGATQQVFHCRGLGSGIFEPGTVCGSIGNAYEARGIIALSNGKSLVAATVRTLPSDPAVSVLRFSTDGNLDLTFPIFSTWDFSGAASEAADLAATPEGKILVFGASSVLGGEFAVLRLRPGGAIDPLFDRNPESPVGTPGDGRVILWHYDLLPTFNFATAARMALDGRGRAILVGSICRSGSCGSDSDWDFMIQRLNVRNDILIDGFE